MLCAIFLLPFGSDKDTSGHQNIGRALGDVTASCSVTFTAIRPLRVLLSC